MNSQYEYLRQVRPNVVNMMCGGWLATSPREAAIRIGVVGISEADARTKFSESLGRWIDILTDDDNGVVNGSTLHGVVSVHN